MSPIRAVPNNQAAAGTGTGDREGVSNSRANMEYDRILSLEFSPVGLEALGFIGNSNSHSDAGSN